MPNLKQLIAYLQEIHDPENTLVFAHEDEAVENDTEFIILDSLPLSAMEA